MLAAAESLAAAALAAWLAARCDAWWMFWAAAAVAPFLLMRMWESSLLSLQMSQRVERWQARNPRASLAVASLITIAVALVLVQCVAWVWGIQAVDGPVAGMPWWLIGLIGGMGGVGGALHTLGLFHVGLVRPVAIVTAAARKPGKAARSIIANWWKTVLSTDLANVPEELPTDPGYPPLDETEDLDHPLGALAAVARLELTALKTAGAWRGWLGLRLLQALGVAGMFVTVVMPCLLARMVVKATWPVWLVPMWIAQRWSPPRPEDKAGYPWVQ